MLYEIRTSGQGARLGGLPGSNPLNGSYIRHFQNADGKPYKCVDLDSDLDRYEYVSNPVDIPWIFGLSPGETTTITYPPGELTSKRVSKNLVAQQNYLQNIWKLFSGNWNFKNVYGPVPGQNPVYHENVRGWVRSGGSLLTGFNQPYDDTYSSLSECRLFTVDADEEGGFVVNLGDPVADSSPPYGNLAYKLDIISDWVDDLVYTVTTNYTDRVVRNLVHGWHDNVYVVAYTWITRARSVDSYTYESVWSIGRRYSLDYSFGPIQLGLESDISDFVKVRTDYMFDMCFARYETGAAWGDFADWSTIPTLEGYARTPSDLFAWAQVAPAYESTYTDATFKTQPDSSQFDDFIGYSPTRGYWKQSDHAFSRFLLVGNFLLPEAKALEFHSSVDAVDVAFDAQSSNHIEAALELSDVLKPLDLVRAVAHIARSLRRPSPRLLKDLLDLVANATLCYNLGIAPTVSDANATAEKVQRIRRGSWADLFGPQTSYGSMILDVPADLRLNAFEGMYVEVRSMLRFHVEEDGLLPYIIPTRSLGLLPTLSSVWDLLPFSFVVDWFTNTGDQLRALEDQSLLLSLQVEFSTHSVSIRYPFSAEDQINNNFEVVGTEFTGYQLYARDVMKQSVPVLLPSVLSPLIPDPGIPNWGTAGSLLWNFIS